MWFERGIQLSHRSHSTNRKSKLIDKDFQLRYTLFVLGAAAIGMAAALIPAWFFLKDNYHIFSELASNEAPDLLTSLHREQVWIQTILFGVFLAIVIFFTMIGLRMTQRIVGPLNVLKNHLRELCRGNWKISAIKVRDKDEFQELIETYNYFYSSFQQNLKRDLELLKNMAVDPNNRDSYLAWKALIEEKCTQLNEPLPKSLSGFSSEYGRAHGSRHAS